MFFNLYVYNMYSYTQKATKIRNSVLGGKKIHRRNNRAPVRRVVAFIHPYYEKNTEKYTYIYFQRTMYTLI